MAQYISEILLHLDRNLIPEAQEWAERAIELDGKNGMRLLLARDYALAARILQERGDRAKSRDSYGQAIRIFQECGADGYWRKTGREIVAVA